MVTINFKFHLIILLQCLGISINAIKLNIANTTWIVENKQTGYKIPATVPGGIYTDLMRENIINDVFYGFNDIETRWVSKMDWNYTTDFLVSEKITAYNKIKLVFEGVDTFSTIFLNNYKLGSTENMFVRYDFDIKPYLKIGVNTLEARFKSAVNEAQLLFDEQSKNYTVVPLCVPDEYNGECHVNHIRKTQASFSWDWGPALPSMGIWKDVYIQAYNSAIMRDVTVKIASNSVNYWDITVNVYLDPNERNTVIYGDIDSIIYTDNTVFQIPMRNVFVRENVNGDYLVTFNASLDKSLVKLWWPNGYGDPNLYTMKVYYRDLDGEQSKKTFRIGFRTVELRQDEVGSGNLFYFKINDIPIYAKGSNSIPINILPELAQNEDTIKFLLKSAKEVHMNMLRVWGGGNYEADIFYELADEYGILIWQDFMFACNMYPTNAKFLSNVRKEVRHQVRRLQYHPSIIMWAGNNENEAALRQDWYGTGHNFELYKSDYKKLYVDTIQDELRISDDTREYLASSPSNGIKSIQEDYIALNPQSNFYGDIHFYNYVFDSWNSNIYPVARFSSEFGYQSLPSIKTLLTATNNMSDLHISSIFLQKRQHLPQGFDKMTALLNYRFNLPAEDDKNYIQAYIYYSQILQAMAVKIETEHNRHWRSVYNGKREGHTMGALYWQLNDVWVAPSWSGIDYKGNWKMMQYFSKKFFAPVIIAGDVINNDTVTSYVVSDLTEPILNIDIQILIYRWDFMEPVMSHTISIPKIKPGSTTVCDDWGITLESLGGSTNCFIYYKLINNRETIADNFAFPVPLKYANIKPSGAWIRSIVKHDERIQYFTIEVEVANIALFVWLETGNITGRLSDNGFIQITRSKEVTFTPDHKVALPELEDALTITDYTTYI